MPAPIRHLQSAVCVLLLASWFPSDLQGADPSPQIPTDANSPTTWRQERRIIDMHQHIDGKPDRVARAITILDAVGIGHAVELGAGTMTAPDGEVASFLATRDVLATHAPGRYLPFMLLDYQGWDEDTWSDRAVEQVNRGHAAGAAGLKEFKRLGLFLRDGRGQLIRIDDPKLDPVWHRCGELGMPVSIHVADPKAFWDPRDEQNERWAELRDHPNWWFGDSQKYPDRTELLAALERVIARHPRTTFVCVHFANNAEDLDWVDEQLTRHPNMMADVAARIPEIGRHPPERLRALFIKHQDRFLFGSDFQVYDRLILGSAGDDERPTDFDGVVFFEKTWRFFETNDRAWPHMTPIQGAWTIDSVGLPPAVLRKIYFDNARKLLRHAWPKPTMTALRIEQDFVPDGWLREPAWANCPLQRIEYSLRDVTAMPALSTEVRAMWSDKYLYLSFAAPFTELTTFEPPQRAERIGLWERDVVELFVAPDPLHATRYLELEWAPNGDHVDLSVDPQSKDFSWNGESEFAVQVNEDQRIWYTEIRIPWSALSSKPPAAGEEWGWNLYRHDIAHAVFLAWNPTLTNTAHTPAMFGRLRFGDGVVSPTE